MTVPTTAAEIAANYVGEPSNILNLERDILRHMEHYMKVASDMEREACAKIVAALPCNPPEHTMVDDNDDELAMMEAAFIDGFQTAREQAADAIRSRTNEQ